MSKYAVFTDTSSELSMLQCQIYGVERISLGCHFGNGVNFEDFDNADAFYKDLKLDNLATTSGANVFQLVRTFEPHLQAGRDILYLPISFALSQSTEQSVTMTMQYLAEEYPKRRIHCPDTFCVCGALGLLVRQVAAMRKNGQTLDEVLEFIEEQKMSYAHDFTVDQYDYLHAGGRVPKTVMFIGKALKAYPMLYFTADGRMGTAGIKRGVRNTLIGIADKVANTILKPVGGIVSIHHAMAHEKALELERLIRERLPNVDIENDGRVGPVVGAHVGPSAVSAFYQASRR